MNKPFDLTEVRRLLRRGISAGHWTLEDLDQPSSGWQENAKRFRVHYPKYQQPIYTNPLRDDLGPEVKVSDPRDFIPPTGTTPAQAPDLPLTLEQPEPEPEAEW